MTVATFTSAGTVNSFIALATIGHVGETSTSTSTASLEEFTTATDQSWLAAFSAAMSKRYQTSLSASKLIVMLSDSTKSVAEEQAVRSSLWSAKIVNSTSLSVVSST